MGNRSTHDISDEELEEIKRSTHFSGREIRDMYDKFLTDFPEGVIRRDGFVKMYNNLFPDGDATRFAKHVFRAYDVDGNGVVDFHEFMSTISTTAKGSTDEKLKWAFQLYDLDNSGQVTREEAVEIIMAIYRMQGVREAKSRAEETAIQLFSYLDKNKNDSLSEAEFVGAIQRSSVVKDILQGAQ